MKQDLRGGVLIIGSLIWDDAPIRESWRNDWLNTTEKAKVTAPIRYGRLSRGRACTYTMVFSRACLRPKFGGGMGLAIPFREDISNSKSLIEAATALWGAESKKANSEGRISSSWGAVGVLMNPERPGATELLKDWQSFVMTQDDYRAPTHLKCEGPVLDPESGQLRMGWPCMANGEPLDLDLLLATATDPELVVPGQRYPSVERIAGAWIANRTDQVKYFRENRREGIMTFQDPQIRSIYKRTESNPSNMSVQPTLGGFARLGRLTSVVSHLLKPRGLI